MFDSLEDKTTDEHFRVKMRIRRDDVLTPLLGLAFVATGYWVSTRLMLLPNVQPPKLMNLTGVTFEVLGVAILSKFVASHDRYRHFVVNRLAPQVVSFLAGFPTGMVAAALLVRDGPSRDTVRAFALGLQFFLAFPGVLAAMYGLFPSPPERLDRNTTVLGTALVGLGILFQVLAGVLDIISG